MNTAIYLGKSLIDRIAEFLTHWYVGSSRTYWHFVMNRLEGLDRSLAWKITLKNLFSPLYGDYTVLGYILGFIFRLGRLLLGSVIYFITFVIAFSLYLFWILFPIALVYMIFTG